MLPTVYEKKFSFERKITMILISTKDDARLCLNILLHELRTETDKNIYIKTLHFLFFRNAKR